MDDDMTDEEVDVFLDGAEERNRRFAIDPTRPHIVHWLGFDGAPLCRAALGVSLLGAPTVNCPDCAAIVMRVRN